MGYELEENCTWKSFAGRVVSLLVFCVSGFSACSGDSVSKPNIAPEENPVQQEETKVPFVGGPLMFTEVDPTNLVYEDHQGDDGSWIEIFNTSAEPVNLAGKFLTNDLGKPTKWAFGNVVVPAQDFMVVYLSGKDLPDFVAPADSTNMIGPGYWSWTDSQSEPVAGFSYANPLPDQKKLCFNENSERHCGSVMKFGNNEELGWTSISVMIGTGSTDVADAADISNANEILMHAYITKDRKVSFRLAQPDIDDWKGYEIVFTGTGDSSTVYRATLPAGTTFPDLANIYGTRMSPESKESQEVSVKIFSYIARNRGHEPHASFKAKKSGGSLYLLDEGGSIMDSLRYPEIPAGKSWSYGSINGTDNVTGFGFADPSPYGMSVGEVYSVQSPSLESLTELPPSGFYQDPFVVNLPEGFAIRCELGGKAPTENSPLVTILGFDKTTTVRCGSFVPGALPGKVLNRTYVFEKAPTIPAVFLTADPGSLFDPDTGIYMEGNFAQDAEPHYGANYWQDKEIPVFVELLEVGSSQPAFAKNAGFEIFGNYSRANEKKSVAITFREKYGDKRLEYPLFPEFPELKSFKGFVLRDNGSNYNNDYIRDMLATSITEGLGVDYQRGRASIVYYNGEYYGIHNIRERSTEYYFETHYGMDPKSIDLLKADNSASNGSSTEYQAMMDWLGYTSLANDGNYEKVAAQIDVGNFINYVLTELYIDNRDWPSNNLKKWRCSNPKTLWKWFIYDTDFGFGTGMSQYKNNIFEFATAEDGDSWPNGPESTLLLRRLLENASFRASFVNRMVVLLATYFETSRVMARINKLMGEIDQEIARDQKVWGKNVKWMNTSLSNMKEFAENRPMVIRNELVEFFGLGDPAPVALSSAGPGTIAVHGLPLDSNPLMVGFFKGFPVEVTAVPVNGGIFVQWNDGETAPTRVIVPGEIESLSAVFK